MGKGLLPDTHPQCAGAARSTVLQQSDVVMLIGARLNWLLSHGKGKTWGEAPKTFIQVDIEPKEMDSNVEIAAPVVGDIGSCVSALLEAMGSDWPAAPADWTGKVNAKRDENVAKMAPKLMNNNSPMDYHGALGVLRTVVKERPDAILVNEGANTLDLARGVIDMYKPRKRLDVGTWGVMPRARKRLSKATELQNQLTEALQQQAASSEVLRIISSSPGDMKPVFEAILVNALRLCDAKFGHILLYERERFDAALLYDVPLSYRTYWEKHVDAGTGRHFRSARRRRRPHFSASRERNRAIRSTHRKTFRALLVSCPLSPG